MLDDGVATAPPGGASDAGYGEVLRKNGRFRWLWIGTVVSLFGDWFNTITLFAMAGELTHSPLAMGLIEALRLGGYAVATIPGGLLADRFDRRFLMIASDILRAVIVLGFLLVDSKDDLWLLYTLVLLQIGFGAVFDPAYRALLPNLVAPRELMAANTIMSATWSAILAIGASVGGLVAAQLGHHAVFIINAGTYTFSAACILAIKVPRAVPEKRLDLRQLARVRPIRLARVAYGDLRDGVKYILGHRAVFRMALAKTAWAFGGAALVYFLTQLGGRLEPHDTALGIGILYSARGLGTGIGPFIARRVVKDVRWWARTCGLTVAISGVAYAILAFMPWPVGGYGVVVFIIIAHSASGANWVLSTVLLQAMVPDHVRGRVFAAELMVLTAIEAVIILGAAALLEHGILSLAASFAVFAVVQVVSGLAYAWWVRHDAGTAPAR